MSSRSLVVGVIGAVSVAAGILVACTTFEAEPDPPGSEGGTQADARAPVPDGGAAEAAADGSRLEIRIPVIDSGRFLIGATEVTQAQYLAFLNAKNGDVSGQSAECAWNVELAPAGSNECPSLAFDPASTPELPVTCVDWCDAKAYCEWAGLRLCGELDGGAVPFTNSRRGQWFEACSKAGQKAFPYGPKYEAGTCNVAGAAPEKVRANAECVGGYPGLFDMSGNVAEWEDSCTEGGAPDAGNIHDVCLNRGGSYGSEAGPCEEASPPIRERGARYPTIGVRCCSRP